MKWLNIKDMSSDKIIAIGITVSLLLIIIGVDIVAVSSGDMSISNLGKELVIGLFGYMGRGAVQSNKDSSKKDDSSPEYSAPVNSVRSDLDSIASTANKAKSKVENLEMGNSGNKNPIP